jgi:hypothetical protein
MRRPGGDHAQQNEAEIAVVEQPAPAAAVVVTVPEAGPVVRVERVPGEPPLRKVAASVIMRPAAAPCMSSGVAALGEVVAAAVIVMVHRVSFSLKAGANGAGTHDIATIYLIVKIYLECLSHRLRTAENP